MEETLPSPKMAEIDLLNNSEKISSLVTNTITKVKGYILKENQKEQLESIIYKGFSSSKTHRIEIDLEKSYPFLKNTELTSFDLRYEYYPKGIELISVGIFKKDFKNPIEESLLGVSGLAPYKSWQNSDYAHITGLELEYRKNLDFIPSRFGFLFLNTNFSVSSSEVAIPEQVYVFVQRSTSSEIVPFANPVTERSRPLQGLSLIHI